MNKILYSFIIPHRNTPLFLKRCVGSIPFREDIEIIVVDDDSEELLKPVMERPGLTIKLLNKQQAKRAGHARNLGMDIAKGRWLLFADADDYYCDNLLDILDKYKESNKDVIYFNFYRIENDNLSSINKLIGKKQYSSEDLDVIKYKYNAPWNKMIRRQFLIDNSIRFEECVNGNDMLFSYQVGYLAKSLEIDNRPIYNYDTSTEGMTNKKKNTDEYYLCRLNHLYQTNAFFLFLGHKEWTRNIIILFLAVLGKKGIGELFKCLKVYLFNYRVIKENEAMFIDCICKQKHYPTI